MPRQARLDAPGTLHHVIIRGIEKRKIVDDDKDRENFITRMGAIAGETDTAIYAWALMTNHAHILLKSSRYGLSRYMRRLLTGYAVFYNRRHKRYGHLFQNRYKSIVCEEDVYLKQLVRYIHLNPLRAKIVKELSDLDRYPWSGHSTIMGKVKQEWQDREYVLGYFGKTEKEAKKAYKKFVKDGIGEGKRPDLVGGGLIRSLGGWSQVISARVLGEKEMSDERILGSGEFVERVLNETDEAIKHYLPTHERINEAKEYIADQCKKEKININELKSGSRRAHIVQSRKKIALHLVGQIGISMAEAARQLGVSTSAISKMISAR